MQQYGLVLKSIFFSKLYNCKYSFQNVWQTLEIIFKNINKYCLFSMFFKTARFTYTRRRIWLVFISFNRIRNWFLLTNERCAAQFMIICRSIYFHRNDFHGWNYGVWKTLSTNRCQNIEKGSGWKLSERRVVIPGDYFTS